MPGNELYELAGRIEGLGRMILHAVGKLEDLGVIDGPAFANELRESIAVDADSDPMMLAAKRTMERAATAMEEARHWRRFRQQVGMPASMQNDGKRAA